MNATEDRLDLRRCPYLGLVWDRDSTALYSSPDHRCYANGKAREVPVTFQAETCLGPYTACRHYVEKTFNGKPGSAPPQPAVASGKGLLPFVAAFAALAALGFVGGLLLGVLWNAI